MEWIELKAEKDLEEVNEQSKQKPVMIFKHSTRCSISDTALTRLERNWNAANLDIIQPYFLDLIAFRSVSNKVGELYDVRHESPQVLVIKDGKCIYHASHLSISLPEIINKSK
jgi:bacillithiol system protein YtxJ